MKIAFGVRLLIGATAVLNAYALQNGDFRIYLELHVDFWKHPILLL